MVNLKQIRIEPKWDNWFIDVKLDALMSAIVSLNNELSLLKAQVIQGKIPTDTNTTQMDVEEGEIIDNEQTDRSLSMDINPTDINTCTTQIDVEEGEIIDDNTAMDHVEHVEHIESTTNSETSELFASSRKKLEKSPNIYSSNQLKWEGSTFQAFAGKATTPEEVHGIITLITEQAKTN